MFNLIKGITLFLNKGDRQTQEIGNLIKFFNQEYNFICLSMGGIDKFGISPLIKSININENNLIEKIKENYFRLDGVAIYIPHKLKNYKKIWDQLKEFENLYIFIICPEIYRLDVIPHNMVVFRQIYTLKDNPEWFEKLISYSSGNQKVDKYIFINTQTEEEFTLESNKISYIRDKKINIFLDNNEDN